MGIPACRMDCGPAGLQRTEQRNCETSGRAPCQPGPALAASPPGRGV